MLWISKAFWNIYPTFTPSHKTSSVLPTRSRYTSPEKFYLEPKLGADILVIDRSTKRTGLESSRTALTSLLDTYERQSYCGFLGSIRLIAGDYLVVVTQREYVGSIAAQAVWRLANVELVPFCRSTLHLSPAELADNDGYVEMVKSVLATPYFYFSYSYDLTHSMQRYCLQCCPFHTYFSVGFREFKTHFKNSFGKRQYVTSTSCCNFFNGVSTCSNF